MASSDCRGSCCCSWSAAQLVGGASKKVQWCGRRQWAWLVLRYDFGAHSNVARWWCMCSRSMLPSDWLDCLRFWRRRENRISGGHCLRIVVILWKRNEPIYSVTIALQNWPRSGGSERMQTLTTLLKAKRVAGLSSWLKTLRWSPTWENETESTMAWLPTIQALR